MLILLIYLTINVGFNCNYTSSKGKITLSGKELFHHEKIGYPDIPVRPVVIPIKGKVKDVTFRVQEVDTLKRIKAEPVFLDMPSIISMKPFKHAEQMKVDKFPENVVEFKGIGHSRGFSFLQFIVYSGVYDDGTLYMFSDVSVDVEFNVSENPVPKSGDVEYAIITSPSFVSSFEPLKEWKTQKGIVTEIYTVDSILGVSTGRDSAEKIRNFIKGLYASNPLKYVLLGGDVDVVPARIAFAMACEAGYRPDEDSIRADLYYSDLDGDWDADGDNLFGEVSDSVDLIPDVSVGRCPARAGHPEDVDAFVNKVINYEKSPAAGLTDFLFSGMILWYNPYTDAGIAKDMIASFLPEKINVYKMYESIGAGGHDTIFTELEKGKGFFNHDGHGWYSGMWTADGNYLSITDMDTLSTSTYSVCYSIGCWVGAFDYDAVSEHFIRNPNGGGVAIICNSRYGWGSPGNPGFGYSDKFDEEFYRIVFGKGEHVIGDALSSLKTFFAPLSRSENVYRWHQYQLNLLGDPSMVVWTNLPDSFKVAWLDSFSFQVTDTSGEPVDSAQVCLLGDNYYKRIYSDPTGFITLEKDSLLITITKDGFIPLQINTGYNSGVLYRISPSDTNDNIINPGETLYIDLTVHNLTGMLSPAHNCTLSSNILSVIDSIIYIPSIQADSDSILNHAFKVYLPDTVQDGFVFANLLRGISTQKCYLYAGKPILSISNVVHLGDTLIIKLKNTGHAPGLNMQRSILSTPEPVNSETVFDIIQPGILYDTIVYTENFSGNLEYILSNYPITFDTIIEIPSYSEFFSPCENESGFVHIGTNDLWHISNRRSYSPESSWYCGIESSGVYLDSVDCVLSTEDIVADGEANLSFYYWYDFPNYGSDGLYIILNKGAHSETLDYFGSGGALLNIQDGWLYAEYPLNIQKGDTFRIDFAFKTDTDGSIGEGIYIDNIRIRLSGSSGVVIPPEKNIRIFRNIGDIGIKYFSDKSCSLDYNIFDLAGRQVISGKFRVHKGINTLLLKVKNPGVYFVKLGNSFVGRFISLGGGK